MVARAVIMVGSTFGKDSEKQEIADVLVSSQVINYGPKRVGEKINYRGAHVEPGLTLSIPKAVTVNGLATLPRAEPIGIYRRLA